MLLLESIPDVTAVVLGWSVFVTDAVRLPVTAELKVTATGVKLVPSPMAYVNAVAAENALARLPVTCRDAAAPDIVPAEPMVNVLTDVVPRFPLVKVNVPLTVALA